MRIAATADLHFAPQSATVLRDQLDKVRDEADLLIVAGDLTNYGRPTEMEPLLNTFVRLRIPIVAVLGNHDYESEQTPELLRMMTSAGIKVLTVARMNAMVSALRERKDSWAALDAEF